ncbi:MAG: hypothetical protein ACRENL_11370 [Candidatus Dormibacteria bacterium]
MRETAAGHGRITVSTYTMRPWLSELQRREVWRRISHLEPDESATVDNIMCVAGLSYLMAALAWSSAEDQNAAMGSPLIQTFMAPLWGAIGTGSTAVADTDAQLTAEAARSTLMAVGTTAASHLIDALLTWSFLFGVPASTTVIAEAGVFLNGTTAVNTGQLFDHALISPTVSQATNQLATLNVTLSFGNI